MLCPHWDFPVWMGTEVVVYRALWIAESEGEMRRGGRMGGKGRNKIAVIRQRRGERERDKKQGKE